MSQPTDPIVIHGRQYIIEEALPDGRLILRPDTGVAAIRQRVGTDAMSPGQFGQAFGSVPADDEG